MEGGKNVMAMTKLKNRPGNKSDTCLFRPLTVPSSFCIPPYTFSERGSANPCGAPYPLCVIFVCLCSTPLRGSKQKNYQTNPLSHRELSCNHNNLCAFRTKPTGKTNPFSIRFALPHTHPIHLSKNPLIPSSTQLCPVEPSRRYLTNKIY